MLAKHEENWKRPEQPELPCQICGKMFKGQVLLQQHQRTHENRKHSEVKCDICGKFLKNRYILNAHKKMHIDSQSPKKCPHCGKIKSSEHTLKSHIATMHAARKHKCTLCSKSFTRSISLRVCLLIST